MYLLVFVGLRHVTVGFCWVTSCICWFLLGYVMYLLVFVGLHHISVGFCWVMLLLVVSASFMSL